MAQCMPIHQAPFTPGAWPAAQQQNAHTCNAHRMLDVQVSTLLCPKAPTPEKRSKQHHRCCLHSCKPQQGTLCASYAQDPALFISCSTHLRSDIKHCQDRNPTT
jgi:hypothetical protein